MAKFASSVDNHQELHCLPSFVAFSILYSSDLTFFENLQTKILTSAFW